MVAGRQTEYLASIDGLRAVAVLAVIVNHISRDVLPSGYLGVDIFFVISGFVITRSLMSREYGSTTQFLLDFYARRMKRLLPALVAVVIVSGLLIRLFDPRAVVPTVTGISALIGASNIFLYTQAVDYFGSAAELNIFTHTWSLGVEEQFYLIYPLLFLFFIKRPKATQLSILFATSLVSLVLFAVVAGINQPAAYFLMPFRFWELGLGCLAAIVVSENRYLMASLRRMPSEVPFGIMLAALFLPASWFVAAAIIVVSCTFVLLLRSAETGATQRVLSAKPMVYVGKISYSLYLWHWPVICLSAWTIGVSWRTIPFLCVAMYLLSVASYKYIERPMRYRTWARSNLLTITAALFAIATSGALLGLVQQKNLVPFTGLRTEAALSEAMLPGYVGRFTGRRIDDCRPEVLFAPEKNIFREDLVQKCKAGSGSATLVFSGDSHAMDLFAMADLIASRNEATVINVSQEGCRVPLLPHEIAHCRFIQSMLSTLSQKNENLIFVIRNNFSPRSIDGSLARFTSELTNIITFARGLGVKIVYVAPAPKYAFVGSTSVCSEQWFRPAWAVNEYCKGDLAESRSEQEARRSEVMSALTELQSRNENFYVFDPFPVLCGTHQTTCSPKRSDRLIYVDESHLTVEGSELLADSFVGALDKRGWLRAKN